MAGRMILKTHSPPASENARRRKGEELNRLAGPSPVPKRQRTGALRRRSARFVCRQYSRQRFGLRRPSAASPRMPWRCHWKTIAIYCARTRVRPAWVRQQIFHVGQFAAQRPPGGRTALSKIFVGLFNFNFFATASFSQRNSRPSSFSFTRGFFPAQRQV